MKKLSSILAAVLCLAMLLSVTALAAGSTAEGPFGGSAQASGSSITVKLTLEDTAEGIRSGQLKLTWNTSEATLSSAALGANASGCALHSLDTAVSGEVELGFADLEAVDAGELLTATFTSRKTGDVAFTVTATGYGEDAPEITYTLIAEDAVAYVAPASPAEPSVTTDDVTEDGKTVTETTATPDASVQGGEASSTVSDAMGEEIVKQAQERQSDTIVVAPRISGGVTKAEVTIPAQTVTDIAEKTDADLRVETPVGAVTLPAEALPELGEAGDLSVSVEKTEETVSVQVSAGGKAVETVAGGVKASFTLNDGEVAVVVSEDGTETVVPKSLVEDGTTYVLLDGSATVKIIDNSKDFEDVDAGDWFEDAVDFASSHELFQGVAPTAFAPEEPMTRAMLSTVLWRLEGEESASVLDTFTDVTDGSWYEDGVAWASEHGIIQGYNSNVFGPNDNVTREQMALMIYRYADYQGMDTTGRAGLTRFTDGAQTSEWAKDALEWALSNGLINGKGNGVLDPTGSASRAEVATVLQRLVALIVK